MPTLMMTMIYNRDFGTSTQHARGRKKVSVSQKGVFFSFIPLGGGRDGFCISPSFKLRLF